MLNRPTIDLQIVGKGVTHGLQALTHSLGHPKVQVGRVCQPAEQAYGP